MVNLCKSTRWRDDPGIRSIRVSGGPFGPTAWGTLYWVERARIFSA